MRALGPALLVAASLVVACAKPVLIRGTQIPDTPKNKEVVQAVEEYRRAMEELAVPKLMAMAHKHYYEHSGTPSGEDDYGYKGLLKVLGQRMKQVVAVRYNMKYLRIHWPEPNQAELEVYIAASYQLKAEDGEHWHRMTDYNKIVLVQEKGRWLFLSGM